MTERDGRDSENGDRVFDGQEKREDGDGALDGQDVHAVLEKAFPDNEPKTLGEASRRLENDRETTRKILQVLVNEGFIHSEQRDDGNRIWYPI